MFFHVRDLEVRAGRFDVELAPGAIEFLDPKLRQTGTLKAAGKVELVIGLVGEIRAKGHLAVRMEADCDRCLDPAAYEIDADFELYYQPVTSELGPEKAIDEAEAAAPRVPALREIQGPRSDRGSRRVTSPRCHADDRR